MLSLTGRQSERIYLSGKLRNAGENVKNSDGKEN